MPPHPPFTPETGKQASRKRHSRGPVPPEVKKKISKSQADRQSKTRASFPPLLVGWKICTMCGERKHYDFSNLPDTFASDYSPLKSTHTDGTVTVRPASRCKRCQAKVKAKRYEQLSEEERQKHWRKHNGQRDPETKREYARSYDEKRRREAGIEPRNFKDGRNQESVVLVDAIPIASFLQRMTRTPRELSTDKRGSKTSHTTMGAHQLPSIQEVANVIGIDDKRLSHIKSGKQKTVDLRTVDKLLTYFDAQHLLVFWYPHTNLEEG